LRFFLDRQQRLWNGLESSRRDGGTAQVRKTIRAFLNFLQRSLHRTETAIVVSVNGFIDLALREVLRILLKFARFTPLIGAPAALLRGSVLGALKLTSQLLQAPSLSLEKRVIGITMLVRHCSLPPPEWNQ
jgi:hypothetical protein